jgi:hypothetical protein
MPVNAEHDPAFGVGEAVQLVVGDPPAIVMQLDRETAEAAVGSSELQQETVEMTTHAEIAQLDPDRRHPVPGT